MTADLSEFRAEGSRSYRLRVDALLDELDEEKAKKLRAALADRTLSSRVIAAVVTRWLKEADPHKEHTLSRSSIDTWRERNG